MAVTYVCVYVKDGHWLPPGEGITVAGGSISLGTLSFETNDCIIYSEVLKIENKMMCRVVWKRGTRNSG